MNEKKTYVIIFTIIFSIIIFSYIFYQYLTQAEIEYNIQNDSILKENYGFDYNELIKKATETFNQLNNSYIKYSTDNKINNTKISKNYQIRNIAISKTKLKKFPIRADILYDYSKKIEIDNNIDSEKFESNKSATFLFDFKKKEFINASLSWQIIPLIIIVFLCVISIVFNFFYSPAKKEETKTV
ncbi:MAG TPA: hypothetical protein PLM75_03480 [bacterium]|nr:hypothetical protein [bacterium]HPP86907.1 hypothetical protein [bacterium]